LFFIQKTKERRLYNGDGKRQIGIVKAGKGIFLQERRVMSEKRSATSLDPKQADFLKRRGERVKGPGQALNRLTIMFNAQFGLSLESGHVRCLLQRAREEKSGHRKKKGDSRIMRVPAALRSS